MRSASGTLGMLCVVCGFLTTTQVLAQGIARSEIVVPTFDVFSIGTTISVPDRGYTNLGGSGHASDVRNEFGPAFGRGFASNRSASGAAARVWIHDFQEMEQALRQGRSEESSKPLSGFAARMYQYTSKPSEPNEPTKPARDERMAKASAERESEATFKLSHAADMLKRGQEAEDRGKLKVAALYYRSVLSIGATPSIAVARQRLASIETKLASR